MVAQTAGKGYAIIYDNNIIIMIIIPTHSNIEEALGRDGRGRRRVRKLSVCQDSDLYSSH